VLPALWFVGFHNPRNSLSSAHRGCGSSPQTTQMVCTDRSKNNVPANDRVLNDGGLKDKNFGIAFFWFDRLFGTLCREQSPFNRVGYARARKRFGNLYCPPTTKSDR
jgi:hypothetical protein